MSTLAFLVGGINATRPVHVHESKGTILTLIVLIIIFRESNHSSLITWSLWEQQDNMQEIFQFSSLTEEARRKPCFRGRKRFPAKLLEHAGCFFSLGFLQLWWKNRVKGKHGVLGVFSSKHWRNVISPREPPTWTETGVAAHGETHGLEVPHLLKPNNFPGSLFTCT